MGRVSIPNQVCILLFALTFRCIAEPEYFLQPAALSWDQARDRCKACYEDLVTLTPDNAQTIVKNLTSDYWIGLRRNFSVTGCDLPWTRWANGDPLTFQNWYPDWAMTAPLPGFVCEGSVRGQHSNATDPGVTAFATHSNATDPGVTAFATAETVTVMMTTTEAASPESCVALASFGAWLKEDCSKLLPFICYEDRFYGNVTVTKVMSSSATLTWLTAPGIISHYRIEVNGHFNGNMSASDLTYDLSNLAAGTLYSVQVVPVKCARDLNPQTDAFYTIPGKIENLSVSSVTETSVFMRWSRPVGNVAFYHVEVVGSPTLTVCSVTEAGEIGDLTPGKRYTFRVLAGVDDKSKWGEAATTTAYTRPGKVSDLRVTENDGVSLRLQWAPPVGENSGYRVKVLNDSRHELFSADVNQTQRSVWVTNLPEGAKVLLIVRSLANGSLEGGAVNVSDVTAPAKVSSLTLTTTSDALTALWDRPTSLYAFFIVELQLNGSDEKTTLNGTDETQSFSNLKSGADYEVAVYTVSGHLRSKPVRRSEFTLPLPPDGVEIKSAENYQIVLKWRPPNNSAAVMYSVKISSTFWGYTRYERPVNETAFTFDGLNSGTLYEFEVRTVVGVLESDPRSASGNTNAVSRKITLSMLCSSSESLLCAEAATRGDMIAKLWSEFNKLLGKSVHWKFDPDKTP